eukprot:Awhi_evm1s14481
MCIYGKYTHKHNAILELKCLECNPKYFLDTEKNECISCKEQDTNCRVFSQSCEENEKGDIFLSCNECYPDYGLVNGVCKVKTCFQSPDYVNCKVHGTDCVAENVETSILTCMQCESEFQLES